MSRVTISPVGLATPGVTRSNDGADHGPDDPGTTTNGIQEFVDHHVAENAVGEWRPGVYVARNPVVVPPNPHGFSWLGGGRDAVRVVPGPGCVGRDMVSLGGSDTVTDVRITGMGFGARNTAVRHLVNLANPSGFDGETSTRFVLRDCRFGGVGPAGFALVVDWHEDGLIDDSHFFDCPTPNPGPSNGCLHWEIPRGAATIRNTTFAKGTNMTYAYLHGLTFALRDVVLPNQLELGSHAGLPREILLDHCWQERTIPGRESVVNNSGFPLRAHLLSTWMNAYRGLPIFGGSSRWDLLLDQATFVGDDSPIPFVRPGAGSTVRARNSVFAKGVQPPTLEP